MSVSAPALARPSARTSASTAFTAGLFLLTLLPCLAVPIMASAWWPFGDAIGLFTFWVGAHQAATFFLYFDVDALRLMRREPLLYFASPLAILVGATVSYAACPAPIRGALLTTFVAITLWHYQRQNLGVYSFYLKATGAGPVSLDERRALSLGGTAGIVAFAFGRPDFIGGWSVLDPFAVPAAVVAVGIWGVAAVFWSRALIAHDTAAAVGLNQSPVVRFLLLGLLVLFFWPALLVKNTGAAFFIFALAHSLQYLMMMAIVAVNRSPRDAPSATAWWRPALSVAALFTFTGVFYYFWHLEQFTRVAGPEWKNQAIIGAGLAPTLAHYLFDSRLWRLRDPGARAFVASKFRFLGWA